MATQQWRRLAQISSLIGLIAGFIAMNQYDLEAATISSLGIISTIVAAASIVISVTALKKLGAFGKSK